MPEVRKREFDLEGRGGEFPAGGIFGRDRRFRSRMLLAGIGTVLIHLGVYFLLPETFSGPVSGEPVKRRELELVLWKPDEEPEEFILTNPEVPSNPPDESRLISGRDQQAAQPDETEGGDRSVPDVKGEEPEPTQNVVSEETVLPTPEELMEILAWEREMEKAAGEMPERLIGGFEPVEKEEGVEVPVTEEDAPDLEEDPVIGVAVEREIEEREVEEAEEVEERLAEVVRPRPRPRLPQISSGPVGRREGNAPRRGTVAVDANFSEYGDYLTRMLDVIVRQWHFLAWESLPAGEIGTSVTVSFVVDLEGEIRELEVEESTAGLVATLICQDAIGSRQPYGRWTPDMVEVLGEEQTVRIRFHYR